MDLAVCMYQGRRGSVADLTLYFLSVLFGLSVTERSTNVSAHISTIHLLKMLELQLLKDQLFAEVRTWL